jgi:hypothetical protein
MVNLIQLLQAVQRLNEVENIDTFFDYRGHVQHLDVRVNYKACYQGESDGGTIYENHLYLDTDESPQEVVDQITQDIYGLIYEAGEKITALSLGEE